MQHYLLMDTETTGLDSEYHDITELTCYVINARLQVVDRFYRRIQIRRPERADPKALAINHYNKRAWRHAPTPHSAFYQFSKWLSKVSNKYYKQGDKTALPVVIGQNPQFDIDFVTFTAKELGFNIKFHYHKIDTVGIVRFLDLVAGVEFSSYSLTSTTKRYKIKHKDAHSSTGDVEATLRLLRLLKRVIKTNQLQLVRESTYARPNNNSIKRRR